MYLEFVDLLLEFVSQHAEYRWHRDDLTLTVREHTEIQEARSALIKLVTAEIPYGYRDYLWGRCDIVRVTDTCYVVVADGDPFHHNQALTTDLQRRIEGFHKGWEQPRWGNPKIGSREARRLGRVQPIRVHSALSLDPGTWYAFGPDVIFHVVAWPDQGPFWRGKVTVFSTPTGQLDDHNQPYLTITSRLDEDTLAWYGKMAKTIDETARQNASLGQPDNSSIFYS